MPLTRDNVRGLRAQLEDSIKIEGFELDMGAATFSPTEVTFKVTLRQVGAEKTEERDFKLYASVFRLQPEWFGQSFTTGGHRKTISGLKTGFPARQIRRAHV